MHIARVFAAAAMAVGALGLAACGPSLEGTYKLDIHELKNAMLAEGEKLHAPPLPPALLGLAIARLNATDMTIELQSGGTLTLTFTMPGFESGKRGKTQETKGTWTVDGESVVITADRRPMKCSRSWTKLKCESGDGNPMLVFVKS